MYFVMAKNEITTRGSKGFTVFFFEHGVLFFFIFFFFFSIFVSVFPGRYFAAWKLKKIEEFE